MPLRHLQVSISAETQQQADDILNLLLTRKLVTGGQIIGAPARFLWKGQIVDMDYYTITAFTLRDFRDDVITQVKSISVEEVPMVWFTEIDGNAELLHWIEKTVREEGTL
jgi:uncharacterized protein involved in tolerance to divalent cations